MKAPLFWFADPQALTWHAHLLAPLAAIYAAITARRVSKSGTKADVPVICIGNINAGGTGKTPTAMAVTEHLIARGHLPHIVTRGFGGVEAGPLQVDPTRHNAAEVGDEPLLLAAFTTTWVAKDRAT